MQTFATFWSAFLAPLDRSHENLSDIAIHCEDLALVAPGEPAIAEAQSYAEQGVAALTYQVGEMNRALKRWIEETEKVTARMGLQVTHLEESLRISHHSKVKAKQTQVVVPSPQKKLLCALPPVKVSLRAPDMALNLNALDHIGTSLRLLSTDRPSDAPAAVPSEAAPEPSPVPAPEPPIQSSPAKPATVLPAPVIVEVPKISGTRVIRAKVQAPLKPATAAEEAMALLGGSAASFGPSPLQRPMPMQIGGGWNDSRSSFPSQNRRLSITTPGIFDPPPPASNAAATGLPTPPPLPTEVKFKAPPPPTKDPPAAAVAARDDGAANTGVFGPHTPTEAHLPSPVSPKSTASSIPPPPPPPPPPALSSVQQKQPANRAAQIPLPPAPTAPPRPTAGVANTSLSPPPPPPPPPAVSTANASPAKDYSLVPPPPPPPPPPTFSLQRAQKDGQTAPSAPPPASAQPRADGAGASFASAIAAAALSKSARATGEEGNRVQTQPNDSAARQESRSGPPTGSVAARPGVAPAMDLQSQLRARLQARSAAAAATNGE